MDLHGNWTYSVTYECCIYDNMAAALVVTRSLTDTLGMIFFFCINIFILILIFICILNYMSVTLVVTRSLTSGTLTRLSLYFCIFVFVVVFVMT